jgi:hypothetical protein
VSVPRLDPALHTHDARWSQLLAAGICPSHGWPIEACGDDCDHQRDGETG